MTGKARMRVYLAVVGALVLALSLRPDSDAAGGHDLGVVQAVERRGTAQRLPPLQARESVIPIRLFAIEERIAVELSSPVAEPFFEPVEPPRAEVIVLGWMQSGSTPHVFVEWRGENHALRPSQELDGTYRFEGIAQGMAEFTYLPEQTARLYRVGDLAQEIDQVVHEN